MQWHIKPHGKGWVVESESGDLQHGGHEYTDPKRAQYWADVLTALALEKSNERNKTNQAAD